MTTLEVRPQEPLAPAAPSYGHACGLGIESESPFPGIGRADEPPERIAVWREAPAEEIDGAWPLNDGTSLLERRHPDGRLFLRIDGVEPLGYRIWAPYYGRHRVSADGGEIASALPRVPPARWQRLFFAEVLPLASGLQGCSLFQASAVALDGHVLAFFGPSGAGKTALTAHLVALGASFVTDDVLALEATASGVLAHPGPARLSLDEGELRRIPSTQELRLGPCVGRSDKLMLEPAPVPAALPLTRLYFLVPDPGADRIAIAEHATSADRSLAGSGLLDYLGSTDYLRRRLEICTALDSGAGLFDLRVPPGSRARELAARVLAHARG